MSTAPQFRINILAARKQLAEGREKLKAQHARGSPGVQVCARLTALLDDIVRDLYEAALRDLGYDTPDGLRQQIALVPHGGYGRRALAPYSDVDLMLLHTPSTRPQIAALAKRLMQDIYDVGLDLGHSVRTPSEACQLAKGDVTIYTSLTESRLLAGSDVVYRQFITRFTRLTQRRADSFLHALVNARRDEQSQYGKTVYLLEPNVKRSRGALRDIHLLRWIGFVKLGATDPDRLQLLGALSKHDQRTVREATEFLLQLRNEMHFYGNKAQDVLDRTEQVRMAVARGYVPTDSLLPVEQFMREYFRHTSNVRYLVARFVESTSPSSTVMQVLAPMFSHSVDGDYRVGRNEITATRKGLDKLTANLEEVLRLTDLANLYNKRISHATWAAVYRAASGYSSEITDTVAGRFMSLLAQPPRLGELLRRLHELRVLERIIPAFSHARCLLQFNEYHKFTVDEHCIRAVECATDFASDPGPLGNVYRQIKQKRTLHLALLLHDLGKGFPDDHSERGMVIAEAMTKRLQLPPHECEVVSFLVYKHLLMTHLAFRRDTTDEELVTRFAVDVGSPEILRMLYVFSCADLSSVGPGVLNSWKVEVLTDLYKRALARLAGDEAVDSDQRLEMQQEDVWAQFNTNEQDAWLHDQLYALPSNYLLGQPAVHAADVLRRLRDLPHDSATAWGRYMADTNTVEFLIGVDESLSAGLFYKLTGALSSQGLTILSAQIHSLARGLVLDRFVVEDPDYVGQPPSDRIDGVCQRLVESVQSAQPPKFRHLWRGNDSPTQTHLPTQVRVDNSTSDKYTILDVFTVDRNGLLYSIAKVLVELELSIGVAKIGTYLDQVVDVFYVTDLQGHKIEDEGRIEKIRQRLLADIGEWVS